MIEWYRLGTASLRAMLFDIVVTIAHAVPHATNARARRAVGPRAAVELIRVAKAALSFVEPGQTLIARRKVSSVATVERVDKAHLLGTLLTIRKFAGVQQIRNGFATC